jgi:hypothetical protein
MSDPIRDAVEERLARKQRDVVRLAVDVELTESNLKMYSSSLEAAKAEVAALEAWLHGDRDA